MGNREGGGVYIHKHNIFREHPYIPKKIYLENTRIREHLYTVQENISREQPYTFIENISREHSIYSLGEYI